MQELIENLIEQVHELVEEIEREEFEEAEISAENILIGIRTALRNS